MPSNLAIAIVSFSSDHCSFKLELTTMMITYIYKQVKRKSII